MIKKISTLFGVIIIILVAVIIFGGVFAYQHFSTKPQPVVQTQQSQSPNQITQSSIAVPINCKVKTYQDSVWSLIGEHCLDNVKIVPVYFIAKDQTNGIIANWSANMEDIFSKVEAFYESQFDYKMQITNDEPQLVYGDKNIGEYKDLTVVSQEIISKLKIKVSQNYFTNLAIYYNSPSGMYDGVFPWDSANGNGSITTNPSFWLEKDGMCVATQNSTPCYSYISTAHEFGHGIGLMHPWQMDINMDSNKKTEDPNFGNVIGNIMGYQSTNLLSGDINNPFGGYYIMDQAKQKMIIK